MYGQFKILFHSSLPVFFKTSLRLSSYSLPSPCFVNFVKCIYVNILPLVNHCHHFHISFASITLRLISSSSVSPSLDSCQYTSQIFLLSPSLSSLFSLNVISAGCILHFPSSICHTGKMFPFFFLSFFYFPSLLSSFLTLFRSVCSAAVNQSVCV